MLRALAAQYPQDPNIQWLLGAALLSRGRPQQASACWNGCLRSARPSSPRRAWTWRAPAACQGKPQEARDQVQTALETHPHHHRAWLAYGDALVDLGSTPTPVIAFERAR